MNCYYSEKNQPSKSTMIYIKEYYGFTPLNDDDYEFVIRNGLGIQVKQIREILIGFARAISKRLREIWGNKLSQIVFSETHSFEESKQKKKWKTVKSDRLYQSQVIGKEPIKRARSNC